MLFVLGFGIRTGGAQRTICYYTKMFPREGFEPYPFIYNFALRNAEANNIKNVRVINAGISGSDGIVRVTRGETASGADLKAPDEPDAVEVPVYSLDRALEAHGPFDVMKMDCEGCEHDAVLNSRKVAEPRQIQMECHCGPGRLVEALRNAGFEVEATGPKIFYNLRARDPNTLVGYMYVRSEARARMWPLMIFGCKVRGLAGL